MESKNSILTILLILQSGCIFIRAETRSNSETQNDIETIKVLVTQIYEWYKKEIQTLRSSMDVISRDIQEFGNRLDRVENIAKELSRRKPEQDQPKITQRALEPGLQSGDVKHQIATLEKLERLSKLYAPRTCHELKKMGVEVSGKYYLDPDGPWMGAKPIEVFCNMKTGTTQIDHDLSGEQRVSSCRERGCSVHRVNYKVPLSHIIAITTLSEECEQHFQFDCLGVPLYKGSGNVSSSWWTDRNNKPHVFWTEQQSQKLKNESKEESKGCQCGLSSTCVLPSALCNCDAGDATQWLRDEGHLTDKTNLPITKLNFGGNSVEHDSNQQTQSDRRLAARFQLGPLYCSGADGGKEGGGDRESGTTPQSCHDIWLKGQTQVGYYMVKSPKEKFPKIVYCDMTRVNLIPVEASDITSASSKLRSGFQRTFGSPGNLRHFVAFDVSLSNSITDGFRYVNFTRSNVDVGAEFNIRDGIFRVPVSGIYLFSIHAMPAHSRPFRLQIHKNGNSVAILSNGESQSGSMVGQSIILKSASGDEIRLFNFGGDIYEDETKDDYLHFIGFLLYSSDRE